MNKEREDQLAEELKSYLTEIGVRKVRELLELRLERHKDFLLSQESPDARGRGKECQHMLKILNLTDSIT